jgi:acetyl esterase/lipase
VQKVANLRYSEAGRGNLLDVYHHRAKRGGPVLVHFHGGGFRSGRKSREAKPLLHRLARQGWVTMSANYRLEPEAQIPDSVVDARRALAWARRNAAHYGGDASRIYVAGSSAGGHLAAACALTPSQATLEPEEQEVVVAGAICLYGFYGSLANPGDMPSPPHSHLPPMFIAHGDLDTLVLVEDARAFAHEMATRSSSPVVYAELRGAHHGFDIFRSARFEAIVDAIEVFVARTDPGRSPPPST